MPPSGESAAHRHLKQASLVWALQQGYRAVAPEVRMPNSNFRADVAACRLDRSAPFECDLGVTAVFECKQARLDFLNDSRPEAESIQRLAELNCQREQIEKRVGAHYPNLRRGETLFPEFDRVEVPAIRHDGYRRITREIRTLETAVFARTKFDRLIRYRCADLFYLVIRPGIIAPEEIPSHWGLLAPEDSDFDIDAEDGEVPPLELLKRPRQIEIPDAHRLELLHRLAVSGTNRLMRESGISDPRWNSFNPVESTT